MTAGIVGLGLIGGSLAKAYHEAGEAVLAFDTDRSILDFAMMSGAVDGVLDKESIKRCDIVLIAVYPAACIEYFTRMADYINKDTVVLDCCGTKRTVCEGCFPVAKAHGAPMVIVPMDFDNIALLSRIEKLLAPAGFGSFSVTTAAEHDRMIAFTSQLAHVASNAYIKSPTAKLHKGFSAGSYKDMTRVAWLNPTMWAELFMENRDYLLNELDAYIASLNEYKTALEQGDTAALTKLLDDGRRLKEEVDGR